MKLKMTGCSMTGSELPSSTVGAVMGWACVVAIVALPVMGFIATVKSNNERKKK